MSAGRKVVVAALFIGQPNKLTSSVDAAEAEINASSAVNLLSVEQVRIQLCMLRSAAGI